MSGFPPNNLGHNCSLCEACLGPVNKTGPDQTLRLGWHR